MHEKTFILPFGSTTVKDISQIGTLGSSQFSTIQLPFQRRLTQPSAVPDVLCPENARNSEITNQTKTVYDYNGTKLKCDVNALPKSSC